MDGPLLGNLTAWFTSFTDDHVNTLANKLVAFLLI